MKLLNECKIITIFGGEGFVGRHLTQLLARTGAKIYIVTRKIHTQDPFVMMGSAGQIIRLPFSDHREKMRELLKGSDFVINLIGALKGSEEHLDYVNAVLSRKIAEAAAYSKVRRMVHISALGVEMKSESIYLKSKLKGEKGVLSEFPNAIIIRPGIVMGAEDQFFNIFRKIANISPIVPIVADDKVKFQPIYVGDLAQSIKNALELSKSKVCGNVFSIAGYTQYSLREIMNQIFKSEHKNRVCVRIPYFLLHCIARILEMFSSAYLTRDQVMLLKHSNTISKSKNGLATLDVEPTSMKIILQRYR